MVPAMHHSSRPAFRRTPMGSHRSRPRRGRGGLADERGSVSVQMVLAFPILLMVLFGAVQAGLWFYARAIALAAAESGARAAAALNSSVAAGITDAEGFLADVAGTTLTGVSVTGSRTATQASVTVTGKVVSLVPLIPIGVTQTATFPVERYTR